MDSQTIVSTASGLPVDIRGSNATVTVDLGGNNDVTIDASSIVLAEDVAHGDGDAGIQMLAVRKATPADLSGDDGDYEPLQLDNGRLWGSTIITSLVPGTGATELGKAIDTAVGATDTGIALLGKYSADTVKVTVDVGDYDALRLSDFGALQTEPEQHHILDEMDVTTDWAAFDGDTTNLATTKKHVLGTDALTFDKANTGADNTLAGIEKTISAVDLGAPSPHDLLQVVSYLPSLSNVSYIFVRVGTNASNYNEWRIPVGALMAAEFETLIFNLGDASHDGIAGNGWNPAAITYIAVGVAFDAETNTLVGIIFDELSFHTNQHTSAELNAEVSTSVTSANVNLQKIGGSVTDKGSGNASNGSQRVVVATDDINLAAIKTAIEIMDDWDESDRAKVNLIVGQAGVAAGAGAVGVTVPRITLASDDPAVAKLGTIDADTGAIKTAVELIDDIVVVEDEEHSDGASGVMPLAVRNDALAALGGTDGDYAPLQVDAAGALYTRPHSSPTGGCKMFTSVDLDESEEDPASGPVTIYGIYAWNITAAPKWLQMFNTNTVTVGTTAPDNNFMIPANADLDGAGVVLPIPVSGLAYSTALTVAATGASGTDNTDPGAAACGVVIFYQD